MHDLDRTLDPEGGFGGDLEAGFFGELEADVDDEEFEAADFADDEFEAGGEDDEEFDDEVFDLEGFGDDETGAMASGMPFSEAEELELAAELLAADSEEELDQFFGRFFRRVGKRLRRVGRRLRRRFRPLRRILRPVAKRLLPIAGRAVGTFFGGPVGGAIGGKAARLAGKAFGLELEGLAPEEQELEVARRFVRFAGATAANAARVPSSVSPGRAVQMAARVAARQHAPGLLRGRRGRSRRGHRRSGRWVRRGTKIIVLGA